MCPSLTFNNFSTSGCQARNQILDIVNSTVYISKSSFRNAHARGLSIINSDTEIYDTVFENLACPSANQKGGSMFMDNSDGGNQVYIQASNFTSNTADGSEGGAIYMKCAYCFFEDVRFVNNTSGVNGGAILLDEGSKSVAEFDNCFLANNTAGFNGVVYAFPGVDSVSLYNCTFIGNLGYQGGALSFWQVTNVLVDSCRFHQNNVRSEPNKSYHPGTGAALYVTGYSSKTTILYILNSTFSESNAVDSPGFASAYLDSCGCIGIMESRFENNSGIAVGIDGSQPPQPFGCGSSRPDLPLFNASTLVGITDSYIKEYDDGSSQSSSVCVDIRSTAFSRGRFEY